VQRDLFRELTSLKRENVYDVHRPGLMTYTLLLTRPVGQEYTTDILLMLDDKVLRREDWNWQF
jgi:hypothetical protein